jgi:hypothetical protein
MRLPNRCKLSASASAPSNPVGAQKLGTDAWVRGSTPAMDARARRAPEAGGAAPSMRFATGGERGRLMACG